MIKNRPRTKLCRYVLSWDLSVTLESSFCLEALDQAILLHGKPDIFNSDQGSQFTSTEFTDRLKAEGIGISMDGRGRALDNIFVERLWRSVKYEEVYLHDYANVQKRLLGLRNILCSIRWNASTSHWIIRHHRKCMKDRQAEGSKPHAPPNLSSKPQWHAPRNESDYPKRRRKRN